MGYVKACRVCRYIQTDRKTDTKINDKAANWCRNQELFEINGGRNFEKAFIIVLLS